MKNPVDEAAGSLAGVGIGVHAGYGWAKNNIYVGGAVSYTQGGLSEASALTEDLYSSGSTSTVRYNHQIVIDLNVGNGDDQFCFFGILASRVFKRR